MRRITVLLGALSLLVVVLAPAAAGSGRPAGSEAGQAATTSCSGYLCLYKGTDYGGLRWRQPPRAQGTCVSLSREDSHYYWRSFKNFAGPRGEGYLYSWYDCTGSRKRAVTRGARDTDIGFVARSYRFDCVSC